MFKGLGNLGSLLKSAQQMGGKMQAVQEMLKSKRAIGTAGGGMIEVEVNGLGEMLRLSIDPQLVERGERGMIEDLIPAAANEAHAKAKQLHVEAVRSVTEGINVPGLDAAIAKFAGGLSETDPDGPAGPSSSDASSYDPAAPPRDDRSDDEDDHHAK